MNDPIDTHEYRGHVIEIYQDGCDESPREWDNLGTMICFHRNYNLGDSHKDTIGTWGNVGEWDTPGYREFNFKNPPEFAEWIDIREAKGEVIALPIYAYEHGAITINTTGYYCPWDSGQVGIIFIEREKILKEYGWKRITRQRRLKILEYLRGEVAVYDQYLRGEVYSFIIKRLIDDEEIDVCSDYYEKEALLDDAKFSIDYDIKKMMEVSQCC